MIEMTIEQRSYRQKALNTYISLNSPNESNDTIRLYTRRLSLRCPNPGFTSIARSGEQPLCDVTPNTSINNP